MPRWAWGIVGGVAIVVGPFLAVGGWLEWREHKVRSLCADARVGMSVSELLRLERDHGIDESYLVQSLFDKPVDQFRSKDLEFRSVMLDPIFACAIDHDGIRVTNVQALDLLEPPAP